MLERQHQPSRRPLYRNLRWGRIAVSIAALAILTGGLTLSLSRLPKVAEWLVRVQLLPAVAAFAITIFVGWLAVTLAFGRVYCSTVCPLGTVQDGVARLSRGISRKPYRYQRPLPKLRYGVLVAVLTCLMGGFMIVPSILDPYTAWERFCLSCLRPLLGEPAAPGSVTEVATGTFLPSLTIAMASAAGMVTALLTLILVGLMAARGGRTFCNTICPVGTTLGVIARYAIFQMDIDTDLCTNCRRCVDSCKSSCINLDDHVVDSSRCVVCFDCTDACRDGAISYVATRKQLSIPMMERTTPDSSTAAGT